MIGTITPSLNQMPVLLHFAVKGWEAGPENARLYLMDDSKKMKIGAWCAKDNGNDSWLQVDLGGFKRITFIATQGQYNKNSHIRNSFLRIRLYSFNSVHF